MKSFYQALLMVLFFLCINIPTQGQEDDRDYKRKEIESWRRQIDSSHINYWGTNYLLVGKQEILDIFNKQPYFGMYKDNYFITGIPLNRKVTHKTADAKFQISFRHRLTNTILPFNSFLVLAYTQVSFWDIYDESSPFADNNYNPSLLLAKPIIIHDELRGLVSISIEHESNGKAGEDSRSWNFISLYGVHSFAKHFYVQLRVWYGNLASENKDLFKYRGYGILTLNYWSPREKFWCSLEINPCKSFSSINTQLQLNYKWVLTANQYLFLQWYNGFGEELLDYKKYTSMVRIGICLRPVLRSLY